MRKFQTRKDNTVSRDPRIDFGNTLSYHIQVTTKVTDNDKEGIIRINNQPTTKKYINEELDKRSFKGKFNYILMKNDNDEIVGWIKYKTKKNTFTNLIIAVDYKYHGQGIAKKLIKYLINIGYEQNMETIICDIHKFNLSSLSLFKLFGFKIIGTDNKLNLMEFRF